MQLKNIISVLILFHTLVSCICKAEQITDYVDPFIGSNDTRWFYFSPVSVPYGLISAGPITSGLGGYKGGGNKIGYEYLHRNILGISIIKEFQISSLLVLPKCNHNTNFFSEVNKTKEIAKPGFYRTLLTEGNSSIDLEVTSTERAVLINQNFNQCENKNILIGYGYALGEGGLEGDKKASGAIELVDGNSLRGWTEISPPYLNKKIKTYFYIRLNPDDKIEIQDKFAKITPKDNSSLIKIGVSYTGLDGAKKNLQSEVNSKDFDSIYKLAQQKWEIELSKIVITSQDIESKKKFYTALWNALRSKNIADDYDGRYLAANNKIKTLDYDGGHIFNTDSMWGSHWNLNQLWSLLYPEQAKSFAFGLLQISKDTGWMPDGWAVNTPAQGMPTNTSSIYLTSLITKNLLPNYSQNIAKAIIKNNISKEARPEGFSKEGFIDYLNLGFIPIQDGVYGSASSTIERSFDDFCASNSLKILTGKTDKELQSRSINHRLLLSSKNGWFVPKLRNGEFIEKFNVESGTYFAEGNSYQYFFYPTHDLDFLINRVSKNIFEKRLENAIKSSAKVNYSLNDNTGGYSGLNYNPGNQVSMQMPWLFHSINKPEKSNYYVKDILNKFYGTSPFNGYGVKQDEDQGQLSAWFVMSSLGIFDIKGNCDLNSLYYLIPPIFSSVELIINGNKLLIKNMTDNKNKFFCTRINNKLSPPTITYDELKKGGEIIYSNECS